MDLSLQHVLEFMPLNTWTSVFQIPGYKTVNNGTYLISTREKYFKRCKDIYGMTLTSFKFKIVNSYQYMGLVAVEVEGLWCRGRMLSYNIFSPKNTIVELIDSGSIIEKQLCDLYQLPDNYMYNSLCLAIKPVNEIPLPKFGQFYVWPLLSLSKLHEGFVVVNTKPLDLDELHSEVILEDIFMVKPLSLIVNTKDICETKELEFSEQDNTVIQKQNGLHSASVEEQGFESKYFIEFLNEFKEVLDEYKPDNMLNLMYNKNMDGLNNIFNKLISIMPKSLTLKKWFNNNHGFVSEVFDDQNIDKANDTATNMCTSITIHDPIVNDLNTSKHHLFKSGSLVEFCFGTNIDFVFISSYEQKKKYSSEMKQFYAYYNKKEHLKVHKNPRNGYMVAACLESYNEMHRALILDKNYNDKFGIFYLCFFVDIGCKEYVNSNNIFYLINEAKNVPHLAHKVGLRNAPPFNNTMQLKYLVNYFNELYLKPLIIEFDECDSNGLNKVILKNKLNNVNIYSELKEFIQKTFLNFQSLRNKETEFELKVIDYINYDNIFRSGTVVCVTRFRSLNHLHVRINTPELNKYYNQLITGVNQFYNNIEVLHNKINPKLDEKVGVKYLSKNIFARAVINRIVDETTYSVFYLDFGGVEYVKADNIFVLPFEFRHFPKSVIRICLNVELPIDKADIDLHHYFNQLIQLSVPLIAEFDEDDPRGFKQVLLKKEENRINILEEICNLP